MSTAKVAVTIKEDTLKRVERLVRKSVYPSRSRLARECALLDRSEECELADLGISREAAEWPEY